MITKPILLDFYDVGLANRLFQISYVLTYLKRNNIQYEKLYFSNFRPPKELFEILDYNRIKYDFIDEKKLIWGCPKGVFQSSHINRIEDVIIFNGSCQYYDSIDEKYIQSCLRCPDYIREKIFANIPDIENSVVCHLRRGDYLSKEWNGIMKVIDKDYVKHVYDKHFGRLKMVVISNDIKWCKENLIEICDNIYFSNDNALIDLYTLSFSAGNICSCSSYSLYGSIMNCNPNKKIILPYPYYKISDNRGKWGEYIVPSYFIRENYE